MNIETLARTAPNAESRLTGRSDFSLGAPLADIRGGRWLAIEPGNKSLCRTFVLKNRRGLHCRPAALLINKLRGFACEMTVENNGTVVDARSILGILSLAAGYESKLTFRASGTEAAPALEEVQRLFETNLVEATELKSP